MIKEISYNRFQLSTQIGPDEDDRTPNFIEGVGGGGEFVVSDTAELMSIAIDEIQPSE